MYLHIVIGTPTVPILDSLPLSTMGRLINLYFIIIIVIHKNEKKTTLYKYCKLNLHSKIANFNCKVQNCKLHHNEIFDVLSLFWNRTKLDDCKGEPVVSRQR